MAQAASSGSTIDIQVAYSATLRGCDVVFNGTDFALDATPASVLLLSLLAGRRAAPVDTRPTPVPDWWTPSSSTARAGYPGDALAPSGALAGSRLWELERRLADDQARQDCQDYIAEALTPLETQRGYAMQIAVEYVAPQILGYRVRAGSTTIQLKKALG